MKRKKNVSFGAMVMGLLLCLSVFSAAQDFTYPKKIPFVQVSQGTILPDAIPFCRTSSGATLVCYSPEFIRTAYNFPSNLDGSGQTIVIVDAFGSPTITQDLATFDAVFGIPAPPSFRVICPQGCPTFNPRNKHHDVIGWSVETSLDVEYAHAMAPGANIVLVVAATSSGNAINEAETAAIRMFPGSIMSQSFGIPEILVHGNNAQILQAQKNYLAATAAGITLLASTGDFGATNGFSTANAAFPSSDPLVTAIDGTEGNPYPGGLVTFTGTCSPGPALPTGCTPTGYGGERVWNEPAFGAATGGAPSLFFAVPLYQNGLNLRTRTTPDVSYNAAVNGGVLVVNTAVLGQTLFFIVGGTSAGSPQWASIIALANQVSASRGHGPLGFVNPALYRLARSAAYGTDFHDITLGNNQLVGTPVGFPALAGWDDATGWGTPNVARLVPDLVSCAKTSTCP